VLGGEGRFIRTSRTQPPTITARPPAPRTARAMSVARSRDVTARSICHENTKTRKIGSGFRAFVVSWPTTSPHRFASKPFHQAIADARREGVQPHERARLEVRKHFR